MVNTETLEQGAKRFEMDHCLLDLRSSTCHWSCVESTAGNMFAGLVLLSSLPIYSVPKLGLQQFFEGRGLSGALFRCEPEITASKVPCRHYRAV